MLIGFGAMAKSGSNEPLNKAIRKTVTYPSFAKAERIHGVVLVEYEVKNNGQVKVLRINASHKDLGEHVKQVLENLTITDIQSTGVHFAKFNFRYVDVP